MRRQSPKAPPEGRLEGKATAGRKLERFYACFTRNDHVLIVINADPDAIASAMAVRRLLWRKVVSITIGHVNVINRPDNLALIHLTGAKLVRLHTVRPKQFTKFVMVDSQPSHHVDYAPFNFDVIIDHHPHTGIEAPFVDIRAHYGATATMLTEYLRAAKIKPSTKLATALFYAIKTDTNDFQRQATLGDIKAFQFVFRHANLHMARKIEQADIKPEYLKYFRRAFHNMRRRKDRVFILLGSVVSPDVCVLIADFFLRVESFNWVIVAGIFEKKLVVILRNDGLRKNAGKVAEESFNHIGSAGGHKSMARAEIPIAAVAKVVEYKDDNKLIRWLINQIQKRAGKMPRANGTR
jgi:nanoRNase/pAp phosphatase (c-di-AMP/oligoRNAs hydrolase)